MKFDKGVDTSCLINEVVISRPYYHKKDDTQICAVFYTHVSRVHHVFQPIGGVRAAGSNTGVHEAPIH